VVKALQAARVSGFTAFVVHGMSGETRPVYIGTDPFDPSNLSESVKFEVVCDDDTADRVVHTIAQAAKTGYPGDGIVAIETVEKMWRIRDIR